VNVQIVSSGDIATIDAAYQMCIGTIDPRWLCSRGPAVPSREILVRDATDFELYVASEASIVYGIAIVKPDGDMTWLRCTGSRWADAAEALIVQIHTDKGAAFGIVTNRDLRTLIKTFDPGITDHEDGLIEWR